MTKKNIFFLIAILVLIGLAVVIFATRPGTKPGEARLEAFTLQKPNFVATGYALSKVEVYAVPTGTGITEQNYQLLGTASLKGEQGGVQLWSLTMPNDPVLATEIFAQGYASNGTKTNKISLPYTGATAIYDALWGTGQNSVTGTIKSVGASAKTILVTDQNGSDIMVAINRDTLITTLTTGADATFIDLKPSRKVIIEGTKNSDGSVLATQIRVDVTVPSTAEVILTAPKAGSTITTNTVVVKGQARGTWFFEANIPVKIVDANGKILGQVGGHADSDWMTTDFVPFTATITLIQPTTQTGKIIISNDNPSGMPENDRSVSFPINFAIANNMTVNLYYPNSVKAEQIGDVCSPDSLMPVQREISKTSPLKDTITLLLGGYLSAAEKNQGFSTEFPNKDFKLISASVTNGVATLTFNEVPGFTTGGACRTSLLKNEIIKTAKQFPTVTSVVLKPDTLFQP